MPKRVIDGERVWDSTKLFDIAQESETAALLFPWLLALAGPNGTFELTNVRIIWGRVAMSLPGSLPDPGALARVLELYRRHGLLLTWEENGKKFGYWAGINQPGRLPSAARRKEKHENELAPPPPSRLLDSTVGKRPGANRKPIGNQQGTNGSPGFGSGIGSGIGSGSTSSSALCPDQATIPKKTNPGAERLAQRLREWVVRNNRDAKVTEAQIRRWVGEAELLLRLDGRAESQAMALLDWCQQDPFWRSTVLSMAKFRLQYDQLLLKAGLASPTPPLVPPAPKESVEHQKARQRFAALKDAEKVELAKRACARWPVLQSEEMGQVNPNLISSMIELLLADAGTEARRLAEICRPQGRREGSA